MHERLSFNCNKEFCGKVLPTILHFIAGYVGQGTKKQSSIANDREYSLIMQSCNDNKLRTTL